MQFISPNELLTALPPVIYERLGPHLQFQSHPRGDGADTGCFAQRRQFGGWPATNEGAGSAMRAAGSPFSILKGLKYFLANATESLAGP